MPEVVIIADDAGCGVASVLAPTPSATLLAVGHAADAVGAATPAAVARVVGLPGLDWSMPTDALGGALLPLVANGRLVLIESNQRGRDLAGWLVGATGAAIVWAVDAVRLEGAIELDRVVDGGSQRMVYGVGDGLTIVLVKPPPAAPARAITDGLPTCETRADIAAGASVVSVRASGEPATGGVALKGARIVVSIGRGIGGREHVGTFEQLADRLGAGLGASRVAVDAGWVPFAAQVGQTGVAVGPDVYLAFGISGALQHLAGMRGSRTIIAVNTDPDAPLCTLADLVVDGDAVEVAEGLLKRLTERG